MDKVTDELTCAWLYNMIQLTVFCYNYYNYTVKE